MPATLATNVYAFVKPAHIDKRPARTAATLVSRWLERRRFARALPWMADEVLEDYGLTREDALRICRRPFWRA